MNLMMTRKLLAGLKTLSRYSWICLFVLIPCLNGMPIKVLFLGDEGHHRPAERFKDLEPVLSKRGFEMIYTDDMRDINPAKLSGYDVLTIFANITEISQTQETALLNFVKNGGGLVPIHCASYCFLNSPKYIELVGGQFQRHGAGVFRETIVKTDHPIMAGLEAIESWDETYVHSQHNTDRLVLSERRDAEGAEPYTWIRNHGQGRVFYTAWGHDARTWTNRDFHNLIERGMRWAAANSPSSMQPASGNPPFDYAESADPLPNYTPNAAWGTQGEPIRTMQQPMAPSESLKRYVHLEGFEQTLFAAEPDIVNPLWLAWDERGRLWIAESIDYPNEMQPLGQGRDRIKICEDTDKDGVADKFTVFADRLSVPTGFVFARGGLIVIHSGRTEFLKDTNGDDRADQRQVLFEGWGTRDTHATASNLRYGFDNWIWGVVGYSGFNGTVGGKDIRFGQGIFRFQSDGSELEFIRSSNNNTWGLGLTEDNVVIGSTANGNASMYMPMANRYFERVLGWSANRLESIADSQRFYPITDKVRQVDWHDKYTAGSGSAIYTARDFPERFWNKAQFVAEATGHLVGLFLLDRRGADFVAYNNRNFLASDDEWTGPIYAEVGPDGAVWVVDWYNYIIQHNPTPRGFSTGKGNAYETPLRDKDHARIYRVTHRSGRHRTPPALDEKQPAQWVQALQRDNLLWRLHAQRLLVERGQLDVTDGLIQLIQDPQVDSQGLAPAAIHGLWTLRGLGALASPSGKAYHATVAALTHRSPAVRRAAADVLPRTAEATQALLNSGGLQHPDALLRKATLLALSDSPSSDAAGAAIFSAMNDPDTANDPILADAAIAAAARHDAGFLNAALANFRTEPSKSLTSQPLSNLVGNGSFEKVTGENPEGWRPVRHNGQGHFDRVTESRTGKQGVRIRSEQGGDLSWAYRVEVKPRTDYKLTGWIKTEGLRNRGNALGALLNVHELQDPVGGATKPIVGNQDWTQVDLNFNSGGNSRLTINCLFGGWGQAVGTAYFDDISLTPAPGAALKGELGRVIRVVANHYSRRGATDSIVPLLLGLKQASPDLASAMLDSISTNWPENTIPKIRKAQQAQLQTLSSHFPASDRDRLLILGQRWGKPSLFGASLAAVLETLKNTVAQGSGESAAAASRLISLADSPETARFVLSHVTLLTPPEEASSLVRSLGESQIEASGQVLIEQWASFTPAVKRTAVSLLMRRSSWAMTLLDAIDAQTIPQTDLAPDQWSQLRQNPSRKVARRATQLSERIQTVSADRQELVEALLPLAKQKGDAERGQAVFTTSCAICHKIDGQGGDVGPDLTGIGARDRSEVLLDILDPNRSVEANYRLWTATTKNGEAFAGRLDSETKTTIEILDTAGQKHVLQRRQLESLAPSQLSIMPTGFEALPKEDLKALLEFMASSH